MAKRLGYTKRDVKNINVTVGLNLAAARRNAGMTQTEVMQAVWGVSNNRNRISEIENGKKDLTLIDLLIFQNLYGQSLDYICGLSTEPEVDMLAGTINHVVTQSHCLIEMMASELAGVVVGHMKAINQNDHAALLQETRDLCAAIKEEQRKGMQLSPSVLHTVNRAMGVIRKIDVDQARQVNAIDTQMMQIKERVDKEDKHRLLRDMDKHYQYSIPLIAPEELDEEIAVGVNCG